MKAGHDHETPDVIAAAYADIAVADFEAVDQLYRAVRISRESARPPSPTTRTGRFRIASKHEEPTRHGLEIGLG